MNDFIVYKHTCPNGKVYIGITSQNANHRWNRGNGYRGNEHFYRAIQKYGWENIRHDILFNELTKEEAEQKEKELITIYKSNDKNYGYNIMFESSNKYCHSRETIEKMRNSKLGKKQSEETKRKRSESLKGHTTAAETREKIRAAQVGKPRTPHTEEWKKNASAMFTGVNNPNYGKTMSQEQRAKISEHTNNKRAVCQYSLDMELIKIYPSIKEAERQTGIYNANICACCKGKKPTMGGYVWRYVK